MTTSSGQHLSQRDVLDVLCWPSLLCPTAGKRDTDLPQGQTKPFTRCEVPVNLSPLEVGAQEGVQLPERGRRHSEEIKKLLLVLLRHDWDDGVPGPEPRTGGEEWPHPVPPGHTNTRLVLKPVVKLVAPSAAATIQLTDEIHPPLLRIRCWGDTEVMYTTRPRSTSSALTS